MKSRSNTTKPMATCENGFAFWIIVSTSQPPADRQRGGLSGVQHVFARRLKQSGMTWSLEGGRWIVDLRVVQLSGIWPQVYQAYLQAKNLPEMGTQEGSRKKKPRKAA